MKRTHILTMIVMILLTASCGQKKTAPSQMDTLLQSSFIKAKEYQDAGEWDKAIIGYMEIINTEPEVDKGNDASETIRESILQLMNTCQSAGKEEECLEMLMSIHDNPTSYVRENLWRDLHSIYAYALYRADQDETAKEVIAEALEMECDESDHMLLFRDYSYAAAIVFGDPHRQDDAVEYCKIALESAEKASIESGVQWTSSMLGRLYRKNGRMSDAMELYMSSVERAKKSGDKPGLANAYNCIAEIFLYWRHPLEAKDYSDSALILTDQVREKSASVAADAYRLRGKINELTGETDSALYYLNKAQHIYEILPYNSGNDEIDKDLGSILINSEDPSSQEMGVRLLQRVIDKAQRVEPRVIAHVNLARMHERQGEQEECCRHMRAMHDLLIDDPASVTYYIDEDVCRYAFQHFLSEGKIEATDLFTRLYTQQVDRRSSDNISRTLASTLQQEMRERHKKQMKESTSLTITVIVLSIIVVISIVIMSVALARIRRHKTRSMMTNLENEKNKIAEELEMMAEAIKKIDTGGIQESAPASLPAVFRMNGETVFRERFEAQHPDFLEALRKEVPNISRNEEILCMMLLLNQDLNQIAYYMGIEKASVNQARYRLRKKMELSKDASLKLRIQEINKQ